MRASHGPAVMGGGDVSIITGRPREEVDRLQEDTEKRRHQEKVSKSLNLRAVLTTPHNQEVLGAVCEQLDKRIEVLIAGDPQCQALVAVVQGFVDELSLGRLSAKALLQPLEDALA